MHSRRWGGRVASALAAAALATGTSAEPTDCLVCQKMIRAISSATGCEGNPCELDSDLMRLDRCHERAEGVASSLRAAGAALEPTERRGDYKLSRACDDLRKLPSHVLCVRHGVCLSRCDVCERIIGFWHANGCAGSPCTDAAVGRAQNLKSSLDCWDALTDMQRGGLLVEGDTDAEFRLRDCTQIGHAKRACELWNLC